MSSSDFSDLQLRPIYSRVALGLELTAGDRAVILTLLESEAERVSLEWNRAQAERGDTRSPRDLGKKVSRGFAPV